MIIYLISGLVVLAAIIGGCVCLYRDTVEEEEKIVDEDAVDEAKIDLKDIKGIGPARDEKLREAFGDALAVLSADEEGLAEVVTDRTAKKISAAEPEDFV